MSKELAVIMGEKFHVGAQTNVIAVLKETAFRGQTITDGQMTALLVIANQYGLNPFTREIYAFPDKGSIVPVVGVDGWTRIINEHPAFDGLEFEQDAESCTCIIYRKDRTHPTKVTEWLSECKRDNAQPWKSHPKRMLRHKALIQCARLAFGFSGIYDTDEAERITEREVYEVPPVAVYEAPALEYCTNENFNSKVDQWNEIVTSGKKTAAELIAAIETKGLLTDEQKEEILSWA